VTHLRRKPGADAIDQKLAALSTNDVVLCSVVKAELRYGAERSQQPAKNHSELDTFFAAFVSLGFDDAAAGCYGRIRAQLESQGMIIGPNDLLIAAIALSNKVTLVTHDVSEFSRVAGLQFEDWQSTV
jgi:tRNA(fMet)-specific endonuclease VapC